VRRRGVLLILGVGILTAVSIVVFLAQRPPADPPPPPAVVARVADVSSTPLAVQVVMRRGSDRVLQRDQLGFGRCSSGTMGCPATLELRPVTVFLVRDDVGALHAFVGEDPRNGCALEWMALPRDPNGIWFIDGVRVDAVFHDVCHGSVYDRRGRLIGGPSPYDLNALTIEDRGGDLWVDPARIVVGCRECRR
jgi:hypothetical protein